MCLQCVRSIPLCFVIRILISVFLSTLCFLLFGSSTFFSLFSVFKVLEPLYDTADLWRWTMCAILLNRYTIQLCYKSSIFFSSLYTYNHFDTISKLLFCSSSILSFFLFIIFPLDFVRFIKKDNGNCNTALQRLIFRSFRVVLSTWSCRNNLSLTFPRMLGCIDLVSYDKLWRS